jgi:hypothetical protein
MAARTDRPRCRRVRPPADVTFVSPRDRTTRQRDRGLLAPAADAGLHFAELVGTVLTCATNDEARAPAGVAGTDERPKSGDLRAETRLCVGAAVTQRSRVLRPGVGGAHDSDLRWNAPPHRRGGASFQPPALAPRAVCGGACFSEQRSSVISASGDRVAATAGAAWVSLALSRRPEWPITPIPELRQRTSSAYAPPVPGRAAC